jgi:hypothetical protein
MPANCSGDEGVRKPSIRHASSTCFTLRRIGALYVGEASQGGVAVATTISAKPQSDDEVGSALNWNKSLTLREEALHRTVNPNPPCTAWGPARNKGGRLARRAAVAPSSFIDPRRFNRHPRLRKP